MAKKAKKASRKFNLRCHDEDLAAFREASEREGFGGNVTSWMLWHLRRLAKKKSR